MGPEEQTASSEGPPRSTRPDGGDPSQGLGIRDHACRRDRRKRKCGGQGELGGQGRAGGVGASWGAGRAGGGRASWGEGVGRGGLVGGGRAGEGAGLVGGGQGWWEGAGRGGSLTAGSPGQAQQSGASREPVRSALFCPAQPLALRSGWASAPDVGWLAGLESQRAFVGSTCHGGAVRGLVVVTACKEEAARPGQQGALHPRGAGSDRRVWEADGGAENDCGGFLFH